MYDPSSAYICFSILISFCSRLLFFSKAFCISDATADGLFLKLSSILIAASESWNWDDTKKKEFGK